jgi:hypothetical protein
VSNDSKLYDQEEGSSLRVSPKGRSSLQHNLIDLFRSGKDIEMGVSLTDMGSKSKIFAEHNTKPDNKLKLSQFKEMKSSFRPRARNYSDLLKISETKVANDVGSPFEAKLRSRDLFADSDASSKVVSSSFSYSLEKSGTITKNEKVFSANFE